VIDLPTNALGQVFDNHFVAGSVWRYKKFFFFATGEERDKYLIVLNPKSTDNNSYFLLPTSQTHKIESNVLIHADCFLITKGCEECFIEDTLVDVTNIHTKPFDELKRAYVALPFVRKIEHKGNLNPQTFNQICTLVKDSDRISPKVQSLIFPS